MVKKILNLLIVVLVLLMPLEMAVASKSQLDNKYIDSVMQNAPQRQIIEEPDWKFGSDQVPVFSLDHRELRVSSGCDVNGDGFDDVIVADRDYDHQYAQDDNGRVWLFYGREDGLNTTPDITFTPPYINTFGFFGANATCAGDVNNDTFDDIIISEPNYDSSGSDEGAVFVYYGSNSGPSTTYSWMARGFFTYGHFGHSVDSAGDVNGDGYDDIIVGTTETHILTHVFVWHGGPGGLGDTGLPSNADWTASSSNPGLYGYGQFVRGIGDVNGDSFDDILIGADYYDGSVTDQGAVFVYYGSISGLGSSGTPANADWMATSGQTNSLLGRSGGKVGDLNGDGFDDLAVGAYGYDNPDTNEGKVFVWYGSTSGLGDYGTPANVDWSAETDVIGSNLGFVVRSAGDVNQDGYADLLATAPNYQFDSDGDLLTGAGAWFVWTGSANGLGDNGTISNAYIAGYGDQENGRLGRDDAGAGDVNGDGLDDIFVAAYLYDDPEIDEGVVFGYYSKIYHSLYLPLILR